MNHVEFVVMCLKTAKCTICNKVNRIVCKLCKTKTCEQFHAICMPAFETNTQIMSKIESSHNVITIT